MGGLHLCPQGLTLSLSTWACLTPSPPCLCSPEHGSIQPTATRKGILRMKGLEK